MFCLCAQNEKVPKKEDVSEINGIKILRKEEKCETVKLSLLLHSSSSSLVL